MHPRTKKKLIEINLYEKVINSLNIIEPQGYQNLLYLIKHSELVISDSGGIPKEAAFLGKASIYIGTKIIWIELYRQNWSYLLHSNNINDLEKVYNKFKNNKNRKKLEGFGNGKASDKIAKFLSTF
jgi:UDP-GlcNAc3NAcA epimerase